MIFNLDPGLDTLELSSGPVFDSYISCAGKYIYVITYYTPRVDELAEGANYGCRLFDDIFINLSGNDLNILNNRTYIWYRAVVAPPHLINVDC